MALRATKFHEDAARPVGRAPSGRPGLAEPPGSASGKRDEGVPRGPGGMKTGARGDNIAAGGCVACGRFRSGEVETVTGV
jgi:hypothetical protein